MKSNAELHTLSRKIYLEIDGPTEDDARGDRERLLESLPEEFRNATMPVSVMRTLYPMCRMCGWKLTVTLVWCGTGWEIRKVEPGDTSKRLFGFAVDYGSTTIVMQAVNLMTGEILAEESRFNPQIARGDEILSRIFYTKDQSGHLAELQRSTAECFNGLIRACTTKAGISKEEFTAMTVGGNTTMIHFLLGIFPWPVFETPYAPVVQNPGFVPASDLGIDLNGYIYFFPAAGNYLGGDVISGLLASGIERSDQLSVFIDIGTNGELVAGNSEYLLAGAGAAGPALEGGISRYGMRAEDGAVDRVMIEDGSLKIHTIGDEKPKGICGSGIVDLLSAMFLNGWVDSIGNFREGISDRIIIVKNSLDEERLEPAVCYAWADESRQGENLVFTQSDVREFIRTKAAAHTMVEYLIELFGLNDSDISAFYLAGAFGKYLDLESAINIGMYPDLPREKFVVVGNSSLDGAYRMLMDLRCLEEVDRILNKITYVQFGNAGNFVEKMHAAQFLPHTDPDKYPSVMKKQEKKEKLCYADCADRD